MQQQIEIVRALLAEHLPAGMAMERARNIAQAMCNPEAKADAVAASMVMDCWTTEGHLIPVSAGEALVVVLSDWPAELRDA